MFARSSKQILKSIYGRKVHSVHQVVVRIDFKLDDDIPRELLAKLEQWFVRYLGGMGHVRHPSLDGLLGPETIREDASNPIYRVQRFVEVVSGLRLLPTEDYRRFTVCTRSVDKFSTSITASCRFI